MDQKEKGISDMINGIDLSVDNDIRQREHGLSDGILSALSCRASREIVPWGPSALTSGPLTQVLRSTGAEGKSDGRHRGPDG